LEQQIKTITSTSHSIKKVPTAAVKRRPEKKKNSKK
jgi:hypothetical protein